MAESRLIQKQLAGKEDLLLGIGTVSQARATGVKTITKLNATHFGGVLVVDTINDLNSLDKNQLDEQVVLVKEDGLTYIYNGTSWVTKTTVENIEDLATYTGTGLVIVKDVNRGGTFVSKTEVDIDPSTRILYTVNGGTVFAKLGGGFWVRQYSGAVSVKWFGAKGDGITDDTVAIQNAIDQNLPLYVPAGTYLVTSSLTKDTSGLGDSDGLVIIGEGQENTLFDNNTGAELFLCTSGTGVERQYNTHIKSIGIINTNTSLNTIGIKFIGIWNSSIENVKIINQDLQGILFFSSIGDYTDCAFVDIKKCNINNNGAEGIKAYVVGSSINYGLNIIENSIISNGAEGILLESVVNSRIINTATAYNGAEGIKITRDGINPISKNITVENCEFDTNTTTQITIDSAAGISLRNNYFVYNDNGVTVSKNIHFTGITALSTSELDSHRGYIGHTGVTMFTIDATCKWITIMDPNWASWSSLGNTMFTDNGKDSTIRSYGEFLTTVKAPAIEATSVKADNACTAWVNFDGTTGTIRDSYNVSSITKNGPGDYTINFTTPMINANYAVLALGYSGRLVSSGSRSINNINVISSLSGNYSDSANMYVVIYGGL